MPAHETELAKRLTAAYASSRSQNPPRSLKSGIEGVKEILRLEQGATAVPAAFLLFGVLDAVPIPTDVGYFYTQKWLDAHRDSLSDHKFWFYQYLNYYGWDVAWYMALFMVTYFTGKTVGQKLLTALTVVSIGSIGVEIWKFGSDAKEKSTRRKVNPSTMRRS